MDALRLILDFIFPPRATEALVRAHHTQRLAAAPTPIGSRASCIALTRYRDPLITACVLEAKFHHRHEATRMLGELLAEYLAAYIDEHGELSERQVYLVPIPLSRERRRARGYNQMDNICKCALEILAQHGARDLITYQPELLYRVRDTVPQMSLGRSARLMNMQGAFAVASHSLDNRGIYIIVDDVVTTGATLSAAAKALETAGARHTHTLALAH